MRYIKKYNESKWGYVGDTQDTQNHYSIYDWFEDLKSMQWSRKSIKLIYTLNNEIHR
jgi:hypothetical protein